MNTILSRGLTSFLFIISCNAVLLPTTEASSIFFSEYIEGSGYNKALEIYNGSSSALDLGTMQIEIYMNGQITPYRTIGLSNTTLAAGDVFVIADSRADGSLLSYADQTSDNLGWFNGDDAIVLRDSLSLLDIFGQIGTDPGLGWGISPLSSQNNTLVRSSSIISGDIIGSDSFDPASEWVSFGLDDFSQLGSHSVSAVPVPAAVWLFGSGLIGLVGFARRKKA
ncbi:MAG: VPLPA-CTERM sorting domain-containing protein [Gammaproteobacteria bacterium]|nr:VPLPA-CTERM sorting domain-containing protein [Gammaproteobacteria bacterium]MCW9006032.1 VPLPA-CTERM sorting domain-containing protein [Gammaproteobacteria bacterium]MCW9057202.1 VPLPA-CTERM sorting domain-containing protein [Gammaproteobacteria bacterium]